MKKVIVISYFFTPCNLTASQRALGWAKYLKEFGYYPIIITRNWDLPIGKPEDAAISTGDKIVHEKNENYEVYYLPYKSSFRDKLYSKKSRTITFLRKGLTFFEMLLFNFTTRVLPYRNIYTFTKKYLKENKDIDRLIITASPFPIFRFGYLLNRKFGIKWLADYRDDWSTCEARIYTNLEKFLNMFERNSERKWIKSTSFISTVSNHYRNKITNFTGKKGFTLLNGYFEEDFQDLKYIDSDVFTIVYNGSLYASQPVEKILSGFKLFLDKHHEYSDKIKFVFAGTAYDKNQLIRINNAIKSFSENIIVTERTPRKEVLDLQCASHALIMISHLNCKGIPSSKIYEYLAIGKPILSYPPDGDIIDETLENYNLGYVCSTEEIFADQLSELFTRFLNQKSNELISDKEYVKSFSRRNQSKKTAEILDKI